MLLRALAFLSVAPAPHLRADKVLLILNHGFSLKHRGRTKRLLHQLVRRDVIQVKSSS